MQITIVGGGNIGTQFAAHCAFKGHDVIVYTSKFANFSNNIEIIDENYKTILNGIIKEATYDSKTAFNRADLIFITTPAFCMDKIAKEIKTHAKNNVIIGLIPGTGGGECAFNDFEKVFGLQRVPSVSRVTAEGRQVRAVGYRNELHVSAIPRAYTEECCRIIENIFDIKTTPINGYLNLTLTPSNPILHTTRLYSMFKDYKKEFYYEKEPLFYEDWTDDASEWLFKCDYEVQNLCKSLKQFNLEYVKSLKTHYESDSPEKLTKKIKSINGFKGIKTPMTAKAKGFIPDFNSRYFTADFPYGLAIIKQIADFAMADIPNINIIWEWYLNISGNKDYFNYSDYGIFNINDLADFYLK